MALEHIKHLALELGQEIPVDLYDADGILLLRKGYIIHDSGELERLLIRELFTFSASANAAPPVRKRFRSNLFNSTCPFDLIRGVLVSMENTLLALVRESNLEAAEDFVYELANEIRRSCALDPEATLACVSMDNHIRYSLKHPVDTAIVTELVGRHLHLSSDDALAAVAAALTMNLSMIDIQDQLHKQPTPLSQEQRKRIQMHPIDSVLLLQKAGIKNRVWLRTVAEHHEMQDGTGYPNRLNAEKISTIAQLVSVADIYSAMLTDRAYRGGVLPNIALRELFLSRGQGVDPVLAATLIKEMGIYPPGTLLRLENDEIAIVTSRGKNAKYPTVVNVVDAFDMPISLPMRRDIAQKAFAIREVLNPNLFQIKLNRYMIWGYYQLSPYDPMTN